MSRLLNSDNFRAEIVTEQKLQQLVTLLTDAESRVRQSALQTIVSLARYGEVQPLRFQSSTDLQSENVRQIISTPEIGQKISAMLGDPDQLVQQAAMEAVGSLAKYGRIIYPAAEMVDIRTVYIRPLIFTPQTIQLILLTVRGLHAGGRTPAVLRILREHGKPCLEATLFPLKVTRSSPGSPFHFRVNFDHP
jgi:HEAT repeat protein